MLRGDIVMFKNKRPLIGEAANHLNDLYPNHIYSIDRIYRNKVGLYGMENLCNIEHFTKVEDEIRGITLFKEDERVICVDNTPIDEETHNEDTVRFIKSLVIGKKYITLCFIFRNNTPYMQVII